VFGIGDSDKFDWGGIIGAIIVVALGSWLLKNDEMKGKLLP
jgi:hypothetical protein